MEPDERAAAGHLPRLPVSGRDSRRRHDDLPEGGAQRAAQGARRGGADDAGFHARGAARRATKLEHRPRRCCAGRSMSASPAARRSATRSCRWRCSSRRSASWTRPIPASTSMRCASSPTASTRCGRRSARFLVITHYQRLLELHRARHRACAVGRPHRALGRQGAGAGAGGEGLRRVTARRPREHG